VSESTAKASVGRATGGGSGGGGEEGRETIGVCRLTVKQTASTRGGAGGGPGAAETFCLKVFRWRAIPVKMCLPYCLRRVSATDVAAAVVVATLFGA
jgi:hypothetical protein